MSRRLLYVPVKRRSISSNCRRKGNSKTFFLDVEKIRRELETLGKLSLVTCTRA